ncbi:MAG TPA: acylphosphatase [Rubrobacteraceae bacterium]|nr:acylphosphatase [Rubrobacteraceae bacterium]
MTNDTGQDIQRVHVYVSGSVQGVFFRESARKKAKEFGLTGWIENLPDGRVEAVFEGSPQDVRSMTQWCEQGPPHATVEDIEVRLEDARGGLRGFEVR